MFKPKKNNLKTKSKRNSSKIDIKNRLTKQTIHTLELDLLIVVI